MPRPAKSDLHPGVMHMVDPIRMAKRRKIFSGPARYPIVAHPIMETPIVAVMREVKIVHPGPRKSREVL